MVRKIDDLVFDTLSISSVAFAECEWEKFTEGGSAQSHYAQLFHRDCDFFASLIECSRLHGLCETTSAITNGD